MKSIRVGSRESRLAVAQAQLIIAAIRRCHPEVEIHLATMKTAGDRILDKPLDAIGGKGLFVKELDEALRDGRVDLCVHSCKDMPVPGNPDLPVVAYSSREDPRDVLLLPEGRSEADMALPLGTSSHRRRLQLADLFPGWKTEPIRGNVLTRLGKMDQGLFGGIVLAAAGIKRLGLWDRVGRVFSVEEIIPAAGQGVLAVQGRQGEDYSYLDGVNDPDAAEAAKAERAFAQALGGGCSAPIAAYATVDRDSVHLRGFFVNAAGRPQRGEASGKRGDGEFIGRELALRLKEKE